jgi:hypothetical protein
MKVSTYVIFERVVRSERKIRARLRLPLVKQDTAKAVRFLLSTPGFRKRKQSFLH